MKLWSVFRWMTMLESTEKAVRVLEQCMPVARGG